MDNFKIRIVGEGKDSLAQALAIAFRHNCPGGKVTHYTQRNMVVDRHYYGDPVTTHTETWKDSTTGVPTLILLWSDDKQGALLPYPMGLERATQFVEGWLEGVERGPQPDHDGSNGKGWFVFTDDWGHVAGREYGVIGIQPAWAMYGK